MRWRGGGRRFTIEADNRLVLNGGFAVTTQTHPEPAAHAQEPIPPLRHGDRLTRDEFERRYNAMPHINKAELLEGMVYMPPPVSLEHGRPHLHLVTWLGNYIIRTPGVTGGDNASVRLDLASEPQPDAHLRILESHGGSSRETADHYVDGAPELVAEVAVSSIPIDLNTKLPLYQRHGVREYLLWRVPDQAIDWFILRGDHYDRLLLGPDGVYRSETFPGLWLAPLALVRDNLAVCHQVASQGHASPEHADFVRRLREHFETHSP
jgi:Uma2 family endonuclease